MRACDRKKPISLCPWHGAVPSPTGRSRPAPAAIEVCELGRTPAERRPLSLGERARVRGLRSKNSHQPVPLARSRPISHGERRPAPAAIEVCELGRTPAERRPLSLGERARVRGLRSKNSHQPVPMARSRALSLGERRPAPAAIEVCELGRTPAERHPLSLGERARVRGKTSVRGETSAMGRTCLPQTSSSSAANIRFNLAIA